LEEFDMKYVAINFYDDEVWVEFAEAKNGEEAEFILARNNAQVILSREEVKSILPQILNEMDLRLEKKEKWGGYEKSKGCCGV
jgi:hypothetical protein